MDIILIITGLITIMAGTIPITMVRTGMVIIMDITILIIIMGIMVMYITDTGMRDRRIHTIHPEEVVQSIRLLIAVLPGQQITVRGHQVHEAILRRHRGVILHRHRGAILRRRRGLIQLRLPVLT